MFAPPRSPRCGFVRLVAPSLPGGREGGLVAFIGHLMDVRCGEAFLSWLPQKKKKKEIYGRRWWRKCLEERTGETWRTKRKCWELWTDWIWVQQLRRVNMEIRSWFCTDLLNCFLACCCLKYIWIGPPPPFFLLYGWLLFVLVAVPFLWPCFVVGSSWLVCEEEEEADLCWMVQRRCEERWEMHEWGGGGGGGVWLDKTKKKPTKSRLFYGRESRAGARRKEVRASFTSVRCGSMSLINHVRRWIPRRRGSSRRTALSEEQRGVGAHSPWRLSETVFIQHYAKAALRSPAIRSAACVPHQISIGSFFNLAPSLRLCVNVCILCWCVRGWEVGTAFGFGALLWCEN